MPNDSVPAQSSSPSISGRLVVWTMIALILIGSGCFAIFMHRSSQSLLREIDTGDPSRISGSFEMLRNRQDPAAVSRAQKLLKSANSEISASAAMYLGAMGKHESIPYLVESLKRADLEESHEIEADLNDMTGQDFGTSYAGWKAWLDKGRQ